VLLMNWFVYTTNQFIRAFFVENIKFPLKDAITEVATICKKRIKQEGWSPFFKASDTTKAPTPFEATKSKPEMVSAAAKSQY
jgi:hypothetical protein